jgi:hypothetical protein
MYDLRPNLIIGFHGCDDEVKQKLINSFSSIQISQKPYDWLGHVMYFWENNQDRAMEWATEKEKRGEIKSPSVIGAVLQLGYCCDLLDSRYVRLLKEYYALMVDSYKAMGQDLPENKDLKSDSHQINSVNPKILQILIQTKVVMLLTQLNKILALAAKHDVYLACGPQVRALAAPWFGIFISK